MVEVVVVGVVLAAEGAAVKEMDGSANWAGAGVSVWV